MLFVLLYMAASILLTGILFVYLTGVLDRWDRHEDATLTRKRNRTTEHATFVTVQTYFTVTEAPFGHPLPLTYGARVAVPTRYRRALSILAHSSSSFHSLIQLPGSFIVR